MVSVEKYRYILPYGGGALIDSREGQMVSSAQARYRGRVARK